MGYAMSQANERRSRGIFPAGIPRAWESQSKRLDRATGTSQPVRTILKGRLTVCLFRDPWPA